MSPMLTAFIIIVLGYLLGSIQIKGVRIGTSGVLLVALVFGHFGFEVPSAIRELGLISFVTAVGFIAGPSFFRNFKKKALAYVVIGVFTILVGAGACVAMMRLIGIPTPLGVGMMTGALTSTPGLAAAIEATGDSIASIGYGIAYPFGVLGVVLFVQIVYKMKHKMPEGAKEEAASGGSQSEAQREEACPKPGLLRLEPVGIFPFSAAVVLGILLGMINIPLPGGAVFSLGNSGGPLISGLLIGHLGRVGPISLEVPKATLRVFQELGLAFFLAGAGVGAGVGFISTIREYGIMLFLLGAVMTMLPMAASYLLAVRVFRLEVSQALGSICGGMTSTPALGTLVAISGSDDVTTSYAATYPVALTCVVLASQLIGLLL